MESEAWNAMKRARDLLSLAYRAAKGVDDDPRRGLAEQFATLINIIENEVDDAVMLVAAEKNATRADAKPVDGHQDA